MTHGVTTIYDNGKRFLIFYVTENGVTEWYTDKDKYLERIRK